MSPRPDAPGRAADLAQGEALVRRAVQRWQGTDAPSAHAPDWLAQEQPLALVFNGISHAVMLATPCELEAFALGFALSEGILDSPADRRDFEAVPVSLPHAAGWELRMEIAPGCMQRLKARRRSLAGATGCGLCGADSLKALSFSQLPRQSGSALQPEIALKAIERAMRGLPARQRRNAQAGSLHAAGWAAAEGQLELVCEDVGRHNALDKLIGTLALHGRLGEPGVAVMSSRASVELVLKCARAGLGALATVSAPTALACDLARAQGIALWGLCRPPSAVRYA